MSRHDHIDATMVAAGLTAGGLLTAIFHYADWPVLIPPAIWTAQFFWHFWRVQRAD
jgi:hypothetical protein